MYRDTAEALLAVPRRRPAERLVDGVGVRRRLQALAFIGHTWVAIAAELGVVPARVAALATGTRPVTVDLRERIAAVYDRLCMSPAGPGPWTIRTARLARGKGWRGPLAWDDETIDDPAAAGPPPACDDQVDELDHARVYLATGGQIRGEDLDTDERIAVIARLARSYDDKAIAARLRMSRDAVCKFRERHGIAAHTPAAHRGRDLAELEAA
jgi:hypothetical protein